MIEGSPRPMWKTSVQFSHLAEGQQLPLPDLNRGEAQQLPKPFTGLNLLLACHHKRQIQRMSYGDDTQLARRSRNTQHTHAPSLQKPPSFSHLGDFYWSCWVLGGVPRQRTRVCSQPSAASTSDQHPGWGPGKARRWLWRSCSPGLGPGRWRCYPGFWPWRGGADAPSQLPASGEVRSSPTGPTSRRTHTQTRIYQDRCSKL